MDTPLAGQSRTTRFPRPGARSGHGRGRADNRVRQVSIVVIGIASVLGLGALATDQYLTMAQHQFPGTFETAKGNAIYTGSILYVPDTGSVCHQWLFDNRNGQLNDKGDINCNDVDEDINGPKNWSTARMRVISDGFRDH